MALANAVGGSISNFGFFGLELFPLSQASPVPRKKILISYIHLCNDS